MVLNKGDRVIPFQNLENQAKIWEWNFDFWPNAGENMAEKQGLLGWQQNFGTYTNFHKSKPLPNELRLLSYFMQYCCWMHPEGHVGSFSTYKFVTS